MTITLFMLWYMVGYLFYLCFMGMKYDHVVTQDAYNGLFWACFGPFWVVAIAILSLSRAFRGF